SSSAAAGTSSSSSSPSPPSSPAPPNTPKPQTHNNPHNHHHNGTQPPSTHDATRARNIAYLTRTLAETKRFRSELAHNPSHQAHNAYPPLGIIYAKDIPTTCAAGVSSREAIAAADAYDDLLF